MSTAFGPSGIVLMDLAAKINPGARVFFIDTGYHFEETLQMVDRVQERFDINLEVIKPKRSVADQEAECGELYTLEPDRCCAMRKVEPNQRMYESMDAWITGLRRDQSRSRAGMAAWSQVQTDTKTILKVNPLIRWTKKDVWTHIHKERLPYNPPYMMRATCPSAANPVHARRRTSMMNARVAGQAMQNGVWTAYPIDCLSMCSAATGW